MFTLTRESDQATLAAVVCRWAPALFLVFAATVVSGCSGLIKKAEPDVTVDEIVEMSQAGVPEETILDKIHRSGSTYRLTASELADLREQGVADAVINAMQETYLEAVRRDQAFKERSYRRRYDDFFFRRYPFVW